MYAADTFGYERDTRLSLVVDNTQTAAQFWANEQWEAECGLQTRTDAQGQVWVFPNGTNERHPDAYIRPGTIAPRETAYVSRVGQVGIE